jgi:hypothetical protein
MTHHIAHLEGQLDLEAPDEGPTDLKDILS